MSIATIDIVFHESFNSIFYDVIHFRVAASRCKGISFTGFAVCGVCVKILKFIINTSMGAERSVSTKKISEKKSRSPIIMANVSRYAHKY